jgi:hypothetical protein
MPSLQDYFLGYIFKMYSKITKEKRNLAMNLDRFTFWFLVVAFMVIIFAYCWDSGDFWWAIGFGR